MTWMRTLISTSGAVEAPSRSRLEERLARVEAEGFWLDIEAPGAEDYDILRDVFHFHPLTIEDVQQQNQRPKIEEYDGFTFVVLFVAVRQNGELVVREHH